MNRHTDINTNVRAKRPPKKITTAKEALEAFQRFNTYRDAEFKAYQTANCYTPGTSSHYRHLERSSRYEDIAEQWADVLGAWLREQAGE